ncbi:MAG: hypothetical protein KAS72_14170 [Phycisphaerales bacterium]|nr:hypothetical protein [Phycisphaerales bacterium]
MTAVCLFHDGMGQLDPLTDLRASFDIRTGALTTLQRADRIFSAAVSIQLPDALRGLCSDHAHREVNQTPTEATLCINGRWVDPRDAASLELGQAMRIGDTILAAHLPADQARDFLARGTLDPSVHVKDVDGAKVLDRPWDVVRFLPDQLSDDLRLMRDGADEAGEGVTVLGEGDLRIHPSAKVYPTVVLDVESGPIHIDRDAIVRPHTTIIGPAHIGEGTIIKEGAVIRANTSIGPVCRVAGEVGATIFQGYANKAHDGYVGDSYFGEWVNLGAGTITSNLKNTYGPIRARSDGGEPQDTGLMYLGSIVGDHVKTAIGTRLATGTVIMTGSQIACDAPPPRFVERFTWLTADERACYDIDKFLAVASRIMQRRDVELSQSHADRLRALHIALAAT